MVLPDSHRIPRAPWYLGTQSRESHYLSSTGLAPSVVSLSRTVELGMTFVTLRPSRHTGQIGPRYTRRTTHAGFHAAGFRLFPFRSPLLRKSNFFLFLRLLRWFSSPRSLVRTMYSLLRDAGLPHRVSPFGNLRIKGCLHLPGAYRSLPRPSSPIDAKASTIRP